MIKATLILGGDFDPIEELCDLLTSIHPGDEEWEDEVYDDDVEEDDEDEEIFEKPQGHYYYYLNEEEEDDIVSDGELEYDEAPRFVTTSTLDVPPYSECRKNGEGFRTFGIPGTPYFVNENGTPEDPNKHFGAGFEIDEPRVEDYDNREDFEDDHAAFDRFVDAGEECVARGLEKPEGMPIKKVKAIRRKVEDGPVLGVDLIGETHWF